MTASEAALHVARVAARAAQDRGGSDIIGIDVSGRDPYADVFLIATGSSDRNVKAIADAVQDALVEAGVHMRNREGRELAHWVLQSFGDVVVHTFQAEARDYYALERLWDDCPTVDLGLDDTPEVVDLREPSEMS